MAAGPTFGIDAARLVPASTFQADSRHFSSSLSAVKYPQILESSGVFKGHELTCKARRLPCNLIPADAITGGGIVRGRISEIVGRAGSGKTSLAAAFMASATRWGEVVAWVDSGAFDPESMAQAGVDLSRVLWIGAGGTWAADSWKRRGERLKWVLRAAEMVLEAGGFGLVVIDLEGHERQLAPSVALRIARLAERSGAGVLVLARYRMCGTFAALCLNLGCKGALFSTCARYPVRSVRAPAIGAGRSAGRAGVALFDGLAIEAEVTRNKLGGLSARLGWRVLADPSDQVYQSGGHHRGETALAWKGGRGI